MTYWVPLQSEVHMLSPIDADSSGRIAQGWHINWAIASILKGTVFRGQSKNAPLALAPLVAGKPKSPAAL